MKCIIIGLGTYGRVLVEELSALNHEVIAVDNDINRVERVKDVCEAAFQIEATEELALSVLPLKKVDIVLVAIGENLGASVRVVALLKKLGVERIFARANDNVHKNILQAFGIEKILIPEERAARSLVRELELGVRTDFFRVDSKHCVFRFQVPEQLVGMSPNDLHLDERFHLKIIAIKKMKKVQNFIGIEYNDPEVVNVTDDDGPLEATDELVCYGKEADFRKLSAKCYKQGSSIATDAAPFVLIDRKEYLVFSYLLDLNDMVSHVTIQSGAVGYHQLIRHIRLRIGREQRFSVLLIQR